MTRFDQAFKDEVRARNDIVEVISSYVKLDRRGNRYVGLCPFHGEKTPSFHVIPDMQIYHCFGCKASGDVFAFVQDREQMTFFEALLHLAKRARIALPQEERSPEEEQAYRERRAVYDALELSARIYHNELMSQPGKAALDYLLGRGLTEETIRQFQLGWAPGYGRLYRALSKRFSPEVCQKAGLILARREGSGYMDAFYERVMFPITDLRGRVIGFGGRILGGNGPKYKNTAETAVFSKRQVLFGMAQAVKSMRTRNQAILVEGYMDVIMPHQVGVTNTVAPLGTALTDDQCAMLRQQAEQVVVAFDSDTAGQMATLRGLEKLYDTGCDVRILRLPDGKDPDEFIRAHGVQAFEQCVAEAIPLVEFKLRLALARNAGNNPETKAKALDAVARVLADLKNDLLREEYVHRVANELADTPMDIRELKLAIDRQMNRFLRQEIQHNQTDSRNNIRVLGAGQANAQPPERPGPPVRNQGATPADLVQKAERTLLFFLLQYPNMVIRLTKELGETPFADPTHAIVFAAAQPLCQTGQSGALFTRLLDGLSDDVARAVVTDLAANPVVTLHWEKEAADCIENIKKHRDSRRINELSNLIRAAEAAGTKPDEAVLREYIHLQTRMKKGRNS